MIRPARASTEPRRFHPGMPDLLVHIRNSFRIYEQIRHLSGHWCAKDFITKGNRGVLGFLHNVGRGESRTRSVGDENLSFI